MPRIIYDIKNRVFRDFINTAIEKSDAFLLVNRKHRVKKSFEHKVDIYCNSCLPFLNELEQFILKRRHDPQWPSTFVSDIPRSEAFDINVYKAEKQLLSILYKPKSLFNYMYPDYPEDLCFFKNNYCWFRTTSHEKEAYLHADSEEDVRMWEELGLEFVDGFDEHFDLHERYYEEY